MREMRLGDIQGREVIDNKGKRIGRVDDVTIDAEGWSVRGVVVELNKDVAEDLDLKRRFGSSRIDLQPGRIQAMGETVILNLSERDLAAVLRG